MAAIITLDSLKKILKKFQEIIFNKYNDKITEIEQKNTEQDTNLQSEIARATDKENELSGRCDSYDLHIENIENSVSANTNAITILNSGSTVDGSVDNKIKNALSDVTELQFNVVEELPTTGENGVIYFILNSTISEGKNYYDEYAWINDKFELLGQAVTEIDLSNYHTKEEISDLLSDKATKTEVSTETSARESADTTLQKSININTSNISANTEAIEANAEAISDLQTSLENKVDKDDTKGLSTNDFTDTYKEKLDNLSNYDDASISEAIEANAEAISGLQTSLKSKVDKESGKGLSANDFTDAYKTKLDNLSNYDDASISEAIEANAEAISDLQASVSANAEALGDKADKSELTRTEIPTGSPLSIPVSASNRTVFLGWYSTYYEEILFKIYGTFNFFVTIKGKEKWNLVVKFEQTTWPSSYPKPYALTVAVDGDSLGYWLHIPKTTKEDTWNVRAELKSSTTIEKQAVDPDLTTSYGSYDNIQYTIPSGAPQGSSGKGSTTFFTDLCINQHLFVNRDVKISNFIEFSSCDNEASFNGSVRVSKKMVIPTTAPSLKELESGCIWIS